jgi:hypothetical protein
MTTPDFTNILLDKLATHHVGNRLLEEGIVLSERETERGQKTLDLRRETLDGRQQTEDYLVQYFTAAFKPGELYRFGHAAELGMNEIYTIARRMFANNGSFIADSQQIARLLYEQSSHPRIKGGELNVALFSDAMLGAETVPAIGIFKSENDVPFIRIKEKEEGYRIDHEFGFELKGIDKGCIIFNTEEADGYRVVIVDNLNKGAEAVYWKNDFLQVAPVGDEYFQTSQFMGMTKNYVVKQLAEDFEVTKADKIDLLNRSVEYFKMHGNFDKTQFENEVFQDDRMIGSFRSFNDSYQSANQAEMWDSFEISPEAVKKQARGFKSVLKLDKNFHIYIHGDRELIERGKEADGRKFYKLYYDTES